MWWQCFARSTGGVRENAGQARQQSGASSRPGPRQGQHLMQVRHLHVGAYVGFRQQSLDMHKDSKGCSTAQQPRTAAAQDTTIWQLPSSPSSQLLSRLPCMRVTGGQETL